MLALVGIAASALVTGMAEGGGTVSGGDEADRVLGMWIALPLLLLPLVVSTPLAAILGGVAWAAFVIPTGPALVNTTSSTAGIGVFVIPALLVIGALGVGIFDLIVQRFAMRKSSATPTPARIAYRLAALVLDAVMICALLGPPLSGLSKHGYEVLAGVLGVVGATLYLALGITMRGHTFGQWLLGLDLGGRVPLSRSVPCNLLLIIEVAGSFIVPLALVDVIYTSYSGRSFLDRLFRTSVQSRSQDLFEHAQAG